MGYYAAGDPGLFDFFESQASKMFTAGARSTGRTFQAKAGQLSLGRVASTGIAAAQRLFGGASMARGLAETGLEGGIEDLADQYGSAQNWTAPLTSFARDDMASMVRPPVSSPGYRAAPAPRWGPTGGFDPTEAYPYTGFETEEEAEDFPDDGESAGEMPFTISAPRMPQGQIWRTY